MAGSPSLYRSAAAMMKLLTLAAALLVATAFVPPQLSTTAPRFALSSTSTTNELTPDESLLISNLWNQAKENEAALQNIVIEALPTLSPALVMKLRAQSSSSDEAIQKVATALELVMDDQLAGGRAVLKELLEAGELRKLDAAIGKAAREGKLDGAFFTVLYANVKDAKEESSAEDDASRLAILKHIDTRCQEEVEKSVPAGVALLNKLLRTDQDAIRSNQLQHYLCPQPNVIVLPDGQEIPVKKGEQNKILVSGKELIDAIGNAVTQIRTVEASNGMTKEAAANMVEACRNVAKEARMVIGNEYGGESEELMEFEDGLQPVFRPSSGASPYIKGEAS